jgi:23S rRNA (pseudouridine1915-N3)-methyltransferase
MTFRTFLSSCILPEGDTFLLADPLGLAQEVLQRAECALSFYRMTFPHQMRVILLEQIYRRMRIMRHEPYHR